jgi:hypothetical protein
MQPRRYLAVVILIVALAGLSAGAPAAAQPETATPMTGTPVDPTTGQPYVPVQSGELEMDAPACVECYLGLWRIVLQANSQITVPSLGAAMTGYLVRGTVDLSPESSTFLNETGPVSGPKMFLWPDDAAVTVENAGDSSSFIFLAGIVNGRGSVDLASVTATGDASFTPLGGATFTHPGQTDIAILVGKFELQPSEAFALSPAVWPSIIDITAGTTQRSVGSASLGLNLTPVQVSNIDELYPGVRILQPSTTTIITAPEESDPVNIWVAGVENRTPGAQPGCGGWRCAVSAPDAGA